MKDILVKSICFNKTVRIYALTSTNLVNEAINIHKLYPTSAAALGRTLTMGALMEAMEKDPATISIIIDGDGPIGKIFVDCYNHNVRGFVEDPNVLLINNKTNKLDVGAGVGNGYLEVVKKYANRSPFSSSIELHSGEIADDFTYYYALSEQTNTSISLGVMIGTDSSCIGGAGFIVQLLPNTPDEVIDLLEERLKEIKPASKMALDGMNAQDIIREIAGNDIEFLEEYEVSYKCSCSREGIKKGIKSIGYDEVKNILEEDKKAEVNCSFCHTNYLFDENDLMQILKEIKK